MFGVANKTKHTDTSYMTYFHLFLISAPIAGWWRKHDKNVSWNHKDGEVDSRSGLMHSIKTCCVCVQKESHGAPCHLRATPVSPSGQRHGSLQRATGCSSGLDVCGPLRGSELYGSRRHGSLMLRFRSEQCQEQKNPWGDCDLMVFTGREQFIYEAPTRKKIKSQHIQTGFTDLLFRQLSWTNESVS